MTPDDRLSAYARLAVRVGANVAPGQELAVDGCPAHAPLVRALAREGYAAGARYVDVRYRDEHVRRALVELGPEESLDWTPPWLVARMEGLGSRRAALVSITGDEEPNLFSGLDGRRVGRARMRALTEASLRQIGERRINWTVVAYPTEGWARTVFGDPDVERLWRAIEQAVRLDEPDPVAAWRAHVERLARRAHELTERRFDGVRFRGPGTELHVGLLPGSI